MLNVRYVLLSPHYTNEESQRLLNLTYKSWKNTFNQVLESAGDELNLDDFFRYDMIGVLLHGDSIIGSHYFSLFDLKLDCCLEHHFMESLSSATRSKLIAENKTLLYSLEFTNITPEWRKSTANIRWVDILTGCGLMALDQTTANGIIGTPRIDIKVDQTAIRMGAVEIQEPVKKMNYSCAVIYFPKLQERKFHSEEVQHSVNSIWRSHESYLPPLENSKFNRTAA